MKQKVKLIKKETEKEKITEHQTNEPGKREIHENQNEPKYFTHVLQVGSYKSWEGKDTATNTTGWLRGELRDLYYGALGGVPGEGVTERAGGGGAARGGGVEQSK